MHHISLRTSTLSASDEAPQTFARYRLLSHLGTHGCLGEGSYGTVYAAWDTHRRRVVVLKIAKCYPSLLWNDYFLLRRCAGHPAIPAVYGIFEDHGQTCLIMEYLPGCTLDQWMQQSLSGTIECCLDLGAQLCRILALLASREVVHNDLKPANLFLCGHRLILLDFGMAHLLGQPEPFAGGTPGYVAPERRSFHIANAQTDLYSAGCVLAQLFEVCSPPTTQPAADDPHWSCLETVIGAMLHPDPCFRADWRCVQEALRFLQSVQHPRALRFWPLRWCWWRGQSMLRRLSQEISEALASLVEPFPSTTTEPLAQTNEQAAHVL
jgi:serine/threonine protein kinase